jgi:hypothetical protein
MIVTRAAFRAVWVLLASCLVWLPAPAYAQRFDLTVSPLSITLPASDPDTVPIVSSAPVQLTYRVRAYSGPWTITLLAMGDLISGASTVDISNVTWVATPAPPFQNGTMSKTVAQRLASGTGNVNPAQQGQITFRLANSWTYVAGLYTQTVVFTISAP